RGCPVMNAVVPVSGLLRARSAASDDLGEVSDGGYAPPPWYVPQLRFNELAREQLCGLSVHAGRGAALGLGSHGIEVDEPRLEERPRHRRQGRVLLAVQLDFVVEGRVDTANRSLRLARGECDRKTFEHLLVQTRPRR